MSNGFEQPNVNNILYIGNCLFQRIDKRLMHVVLRFRCEVHSNEIFLK